MLYIILLITCNSANQCTYVATQYQDLTLTQCEKILPSVKKDLPEGTIAQCILLDLE